MFSVVTIGAESGEERAESVKEDSWAFLLTAFGLLTLGVLGREESCSLLISTGVLQSNDFGELVNYFKIALRISGFIIYVTVFL